MTDTSTSAGLEAALTYATLFGWRVVPIVAGQKRPAVNDWVNAATTDPDLIVDWWTAHPSHGVGIVTGHASGIFVLDVDVSDEKTGDDTLADLEHQHGPLPDTVEVVTGSGGRHLYFRYPPGLDLTTNAGALGPGLDIRADGGQVVAPPTVHPNGTPYAWEASSDPHDGIAPAHPPGWLLDLLTTPAGQPERHEIAPYTGPERPGDRYNHETRWADLLETDGATYLGARTDRTGNRYELWARPGATHTSATVGWGGTDLLKVHTTNWPHLTAGETYSRFAYYTATRHGGDHTAAARQLATDHRQRDRPADQAPPDEDEPPWDYDEPPPADVLADVEAILGPALREVDIAAVMRGDTPPLLPIYCQIPGTNHGLIYPGKYHDLHGEPAAGKTFVAQAIAIDMLTTTTRGLLMIDWEDSADTFIERMTALGLPAEILADPTRVRYVNPLGSVASVELARFTAICEEIDAGLVLVDAMVDALAGDGLEESSNKDAASWIARVVRPLTATSAAVLSIDHVVKSPEGRTRGARGAGAKLALIDGVSYEVQVVKGFSRETAGEVKLRVAKDRGGRVGANGKVVAHVRLTPDDGALAAEFVPPTSSVDSKGDFVPTHLMERISRYLETLGPDAERSKRSLCDEVSGKDIHLRTAVDRLLEQGHIGAVRIGRYDHYRLLEPYREPDEPEPENDSASPASQRVPSASQDAGHNGQITARPRVPEQLRSGDAGRADDPDAKDTARPHPARPNEEDGYDNTAGFWPDLDEPDR